jgi:hypothetical protein
MKNCVFWDVTPCGCCKKRRFGGPYRLHQGDKNILRSVRRLLVTANVVPSSPILVILMKEALSSSEKSVLTDPYGVTSQKTPFLTASNDHTRDSPSCTRLSNQFVLYNLVETE